MTDPKNNCTRTNAKSTACCTTHGSVTIISFDTQNNYYESKYIWIWRLRRCGPPETAFFTYVRLCVSEFSDILTNFLKNGQFCWRSNSMQLHNISTNTTQNKDMAEMDYYREIISYCLIYDYYCVPHHLRKTDAIILYGILLNLCVEYGSMFGHRTSKPNGIKCIYYGSAAFSKTESKRYKQKWYKIDFVCRRS